MVGLSGPDVTFSVSSLIMQQFFFASFKSLDMSFKYKITLYKLYSVLMP